MGQVKVRVEGLPEEIALVVHTLAHAHVVAKLGEPQKLSGMSNSEIVYQYVLLKIEPQQKRPRDDRR